MDINHSIEVSITIREDLLRFHGEQQKAPSLLPAFSEQISSCSFREQFLSCEPPSSCFGWFAHSHSSTVCTTLEADPSHHQGKQLSALLSETTCQKEASDEEQ
jgi:hypothetical protein